MACVRSLAADGLPVVGYTWWSLIDMYEWPYRGRPRRHGRWGQLERWHLPMGLYDLVPDGAGVLQRVKTPVATRFRQHALGDLGRRRAARRGGADGNRAPAGARGSG